MSELGTIRDTMAALSGFGLDSAFHIFSANGGEIRLNSQCSVQTERALFTATEGLLIIPGVENAEFDANFAANLFSKAMRQGWRVLVLSEAVGALMRRKCLENLNVSLPWTDPASMNPLWNASISPTIYCTDGRITTSVGQAATVHSLLHVFSTIFGSEIIGAVAERLHVGYIRSPRAFQRLAIRDRYNVTDPRLERMLYIFESRLDEPPSIAEISQTVGVSVRQLERLARRHLGATPTALLNRIRADQARWLLEETATPIIEIAISCGYSSSSMMSRHFSRIFREKPSDVRRKSHSRRSSTAA